MSSAGYRIDQPGSTDMRMRFASAALVGLVVCVGLASLLGVRRVEASLVSETRALLVEHGLTTEEAAAIDIDYSYRNGTMRGALPRGFNLPEFAGDLRSRGYDVNLSGLGVTAPFESFGMIDVVATRTDDNRIDLVGVVLDAVQEQRLLEAVASTGAVAGNRLEVSGLAPSIPRADDRIDSLALVISRLEPEVTGTVTLRGELIEAELSAPPGEAQERLRDINISYPRFQLVLIQGGGG